MRSVLCEIQHNEEVREVREWKREKGELIARIAAGSMTGDRRAAETAFRRVWRWLRGGRR